MRIELPDSQWAEIRDASSLTGADQDEYQDAIDAAQQVRQREADAEAAAAAPANPAMMPDPADQAARPRARLTSADMRGLRDLVMGKMITAWSFDHLPLPYVTAHRPQLPIYACNALQEAVSPHIDALNGEGPKAVTGPGSATTSSGTSSSPLPEAPTA
jgi:hypothetical protein